MAAKHLQRMPLPDGMSNQLHSTAVTILHLKLRGGALCVSMVCILGVFVNLSLYFHFSNNATFSHGLGRLVNDQPAKKANCKMKKMVVSGKVCLCIFATRD